MDPQSTPPSRSKVFVSVSGVRVAAENQLLAEVLHEIRAAGCIPVLAGRESSADKGIDHVLDTIKSSNVFIAIATGRTKLERAVARDVVLPPDGQSERGARHRGRTLRDEWIVTPWMHAEIATAYALRLKILVIIEPERIMRDGMLEPEHPWKMVTLKKATPPNANQLDDDARSVIRDFLRSDRPISNPETLLSVPHSAQFVGPSVPGGDDAGGDMESPPDNSALRRVWMTIKNEFTSQSIGFVVVLALVLLVLILSAAFPSSCGRLRSIPKVQEWLPQQTSTKPDVLEQTAASERPDGDASMPRGSISSQHIRSLFKHKYCWLNRESGEFLECRMPTMQDARDYAGDVCAFHSKVECLDRKDSRLEIQERPSDAYCFSAMRPTGDYVEARWLYCYREFGKCANDRKRRYPEADLQGEWGECARVAVPNNE